MKLKDFLRKKAEDAKIVDSDLEAVLSSSALVDIELPESFTTKFNEAYLTRDRAENDPDITTKIQNSAKSFALDKVDRLIEPCLELLAPEKAKEIKAKKTYDKIESLNEALKEAFKQKNTKVSEDVQKVETEWSAKYKTLQDTSVAEKTQLLSEFKNRQIDNGLKTKLLGYKFGDAYKSLQEPIILNIITKIKTMKSNGNPVVLEDENGNTVLRQNVDGTLRKIYVKDSNEELTLEKLLDQEVDPFIIKSNGAGANDNGAGGKDKPNPLIDGDENKMTLHELMLKRSLAQA